MLAIYFDVLSHKILRRRSEIVQQAMSFGAQVQTRYDHSLGPRIRSLIIAGFREKSLMLLFRLIGPELRRSDKLRNSLISIS